MSEKIRYILTRSWAVPVASGVVGFAAGVTAGYFYASKKKQDEQVSEQLRLDFGAPSERLMRKMEAYTDEESQFGKRLLEMISGHGTDDRPVTLSEISSRISKSEDGTLVSVFPENPHPNWDYKAEMASRTENAPFVIHQEEFFGNESGWDSQSTLTYYEGDETLAAEDDSIIYDISGTIGELRFGHGTTDPNVFYVRNPKLQIEYEVVKHTGHYSIEVGGLSIEHEYAERDLKHSNRPGKFRDT